MDHMDKTSSLSSDVVTSCSQMSRHTSDASSEIQSINYSKPAMKCAHSPVKSPYNRVKFEEEISRKSRGPSKGRRRRKRRRSNKTMSEDVSPSRSRSRPRRRRSGSRERRRKKKKRKKWPHCENGYYGVPGQKDPAQGRSVSFSVDTENTSS